MRIIKHFAIPVLWGLPCIKEKARRCNKLGSLGNLVGLVHEIVVYRLIARSFNRLLVGRVTDYREELLFHSCCLAFQYGELKGFAVLPVVYHAQGDRFLRLLIFGFTEKRTIEQGRLRRLCLLNRSESRNHIHIHLVSGHSVGKAVHLPEVPGYDPGRLLKLILLDIRSPSVAEMLGKRLEHVNARNEEIVALILKAIRRTQRIEGSAHPFLASFGLLGHHAQFAIEEAYALGNRQLASCNSIVARAHERRLAARDFEPWCLNIGMPTVPLRLGKRDRLVSGYPCIGAIFRNCLGVEDVTSAEPDLVQVIIHLIAQPCRRENLGTALGAQRLLLNGLRNARPDDINVWARDFLDGYLVVAHIAVTQSFVLVVGPDDITPCRAVA